MAEGPLKLSSSVATAAAGLTGPVSATELVAAVFALHPEYAGGRAGQLESKLVRGERARTADEWLADVRRIFDPSSVGMLHGRVVILGLALLEPALRSQLEGAGAFVGIAKELNTPLESILTPEGRELLAGTPSAAPTPSPQSGPEETVPTYTDNPATVDALNREGLARVLARRIREMRAMETAEATRVKDAEFPRGRAFLVHLDGRWGAGKTSMLNFVAAHLAKPDPQPWIVVTFNAWQHQRIMPPWWWLMRTVHQEGFRSLWRMNKVQAAKFRLRELIWRAQAGWFWWLLALVGLVILAVVFFTRAYRHPDTVQKWLALVTVILGYVLIILGAVRGGSRSISSTSVRGAQAYIDNTRDPMQAAKEHFADLVDWLHYPVAIFIDDLDRCKGSTVVELLEGVQTLFRDAPVVYVVAADRDWLSDSYAAEYGTFVSLADEPGRPFGYLFLEKTFQLTAPVPDLSPETLGKYWQALVRRQPAGVDPDALEAARSKAEERYRPLQTQAAVSTELKQNPGDSPVEQQARLEAAAIQLATSTLEEDTEHALLPFRVLLDSNPRAMKRLVNAYGIARAVEILTHREIEGDRQAQHRTALWTILNLRWPRLGDYLVEYPEHVKWIGNGGEVPEYVPASLKPLFSDHRVAEVVKGEAPGVEAHLDEEAIRMSVGRI
jgi:KAP family P-loop domain